MTYTRMKDPKLRKEQILSAALELAKTKPYGRLTRDDIAAKAGCSSGLVTFRFGTMTNLRRDVIRAAIRGEVLSVVADVLAAKDKRMVRRIPEELKKKALATLA